MGQTGSRVASKIASSLSFTSVEDINAEEEADATALAIHRFKASPLVYSRRG